MANGIVIEKKSGTPTYKQIFNQLVNLINSGELLENQQLPPEREFAEILKVSRGTVKKAYEQLVINGYAVAEQGSGTFVTYKNATNTIKKRRASHKVDLLVDHLLELGFDYNEINSLIKIRLLNKQNELKKINIAAVDCNLESLSIIKNQISYMENINFMGFLLKDVINYSHPEEIFREFDVIFTTSTHFNELKEFINKFENKIVKAVMSTDRETVFKLANITTMDKVGVITKSKRFADIIKNNLRYLSLDVIDENFITSSELSKEKLNQFLLGKNTLIIPPFYALDISKAMGDEVLNFNSRKGEIIAFNYIIERGSLIYIEEKIANVFKKR